MALAAQISAAIGQPVTIRSIGAGIFPRVTVNSERGHHRTARADSRRRRSAWARISERFCRAKSCTARSGSTARVSNCRCRRSASPERPQPKAHRAAGRSRSSQSMRFVLKNVEVVSGGRTLRGDIEAVPHGTGLTLRKVSLEGRGHELRRDRGDHRLAGPVGALDIKAGTLNLSPAARHSSPSFRAASEAQVVTGSRQASAPGPAGKTPAWT